MDNNILFEEQSDYIRRNRNRIVEDLYGMKLGFDLNLPIYFTALTLFELKKNYTVIADGIDSEKFAVQMFGDVMDDVNTYNGTSFSLKESLKAEIKLSVITTYIKSTFKKKVFPSQVRRKEPILMNIIKRAQQKVDDYFKDRDIFFDEVSDIIEMYEIWVTDNGRRVDLHFGDGGFSLNKESGSQEIIDYVIDQRVAYDEKMSFLKERFIVFKELIKDFSHEAKRQGFHAFLNSSDSIDTPFSNYELKKKSTEFITKKIEASESSMRKAMAFMNNLKAASLTLPKEASINLERATLSVGFFRFNYSEKTVFEFKSLMNDVKDFANIEKLITGVKKEFGRKELIVNVKLNENILQFELRTKLKDLLVKTQKCSLSFRCTEGRLYRSTGEEVLTSEVIVFELMEKLRDVDKDYLVSVERAKEMLLSVLTEQEEKMFLEEDITILEGEQNYYALLADQGYNNVVKIPKIESATENMVALCIHPADSSVPRYDGFAAIALSVKSGDEAYVLNNSNEFSLPGKIKNKVLQMMEQLNPVREAHAI